MNFINKHRKLIKILVVDFLIALIIVGGIVFAINYTNSKKQEKIESSEVLKEFNKYFKSNNIKIIYLASSTDGYTSLQSPILESIASDYNLDYLFIDKDELTKEEVNLINNKLVVKDITPVIAVVKNEEVIDTNEGFIDGTKLVEFLIETNVLESGSKYNAEKNLTIIDYDKFNELYSGTDKFILVLGQTNCSHCIATKPVLSYVAGKNNITINYIDLTNLKESEYNSLSQAIKDSGYTEDIGTPLTLIIQEKKLLDSLSGEATPAKFTKLFKDNEIIK